MPDYEKLGAFYLGRRHDLKTGETLPEDILYDAKDLTTHAVCVGMTGSGKTGLCIGLIEEALMDGIPVLAIDPKGDLGNLLLTFPELRPDDFEPWVDPGEALRKGISTQELAKRTADLWRKGLADWGQSGERIRALRSGADFTIYTPGSRAGAPLSVLRSFDAPVPEVREREDLLAERVVSTVSGLLALLGIDADPLRSREHILLSNLLGLAWREGHDLEIADVIRGIQAPPFKRVGVFDVESFFPEKDRMDLALSINALLASPAFAAWMEGDPIDIQRLLFTESGQPRVSILSIAHLAEEQRMFFVTKVLTEVLAWVRTQPGTSSLRAMLYMDEVFGYFPPVRNPPSKTPMLTLLKQARAYGLGLVLATQNPVDLDYKGLSNTGTWFLGRLQTERDKARVIDGLEGASLTAGSAFQRDDMDALLSGLESRVFLLHNVHEQEPVLFHTRWVMSYLRGPLSRDQIERLASEKRGDGTPTQASSRPTAGRSKPERLKAAPRPVLPGSIPEFFAPLRQDLGQEETLIYKPLLYARGKVHYVLARAGLDEWRDFALQVELSPRRQVTGESFEKAALLSVPRELFVDAPRGEAAEFADLPDEATKAKSYTSWSREVKNAVYRTREERIYRSVLVKEYSRLQEREGDFRARLRHSVRELRDEKVEQLRKKYHPRLDRLEQQVRDAEHRVHRERSEAREKRMDSAFSIGSTLIGALLSRKKISKTNVRRAGSALRRASRAGREGRDVERAVEKHEALREKLMDLEREFEQAVQDLNLELDYEALELEEVTVRRAERDRGRHFAGRQLP